MPAQARTQPSGAVHQHLPPTTTFPHSDPRQLTKCPSFHCPTLQTHLRPHKEIGKPSTGPPLGQAHTLLFPNKNTLTSVRGKKGANSRMLARSAASACFSVCLLALPFLFLPSKDGAGKGAEGDEHPTPSSIFEQQKERERGRKKS